MADPVSPVDSPALDLDAMKGRAERAMTSDIYTQQGAARLRYVLQHDIPDLMAEVERLRAELADHHCDCLAGKLAEVRAELDRLAARLQAVEALCDIADELSDSSLGRNIFGEPLPGRVNTHKLRAALAVPAATEETTDE